MCILKFLIHCCVLIKGKKKNYMVSSFKRGKKRAKVYEINLEIQLYLLFLEKKEITNSGNQILYWFDIQLWNNLKYFILEIKWHIC